MPYHAPQRHPEAAEVNVMVVEASSRSRCRHTLKKAALRGGRTPEGGKVSLSAAK